MESDDLTDEERRIVNDYIANLSQLAKRSGQEQHEYMERDGLAWSAGVHAHGGLSYLVLERTEQAPLGLDPARRC